MTLVSDIINDAYRESNLISIGTQPSGAQRAEALAFVNRLIPSVLGYEGGENLGTVYTSDDDVDIENNRLVFNHSRPLVLTLPDSLYDGMRFGVSDPKNLLSKYPVTILGGSNNIDGANSVVLNTDGIKQDFFYRADLSDWRRTAPVVETDFWPFPIEFDDMFIISLAFRLNPRYNIQSQQESILMMRRSIKQFRARYKQSKESYSDLALLRLRGVPYYGTNDFAGGSF